MHVVICAGDYSRISSERTSATQCGSSRRGDSPSSVPVGGVLKLDLGERCAFYLRCHHQCAQFDHGQ